MAEGPALRQYRYDMGYAYGKEEALKEMLECFALAFPGLNPRKLDPSEERGATSDGDPLTIRTEDGPVPTTSVSIGAEGCTSLSSETQDPPAIVTKGRTTRDAAA